MKKLIAAVLAGVCALSLVACGGNSNQQPTGEAQEGAKTLVMATNAAFPPYEYYDGDKIIGIDAEIMEAICNELGYGFAIEDMEFDSIIMAVNSGKADVGVAGMTITEDRLKNINFSTPYTTATQVVIVREGSDIQSVDDLVGKSVGVQLGTTGDIYAEDIENVDLQKYNKGFEAVMSLTQGKVDAVIIDNEPAKVFVTENAGLVILDEEFAVEEYAMAIAKDNTALLEEVNGALATLQANGTIDAIIGKYISAE